MTRWAAVLAGGSGTRFWPLSTPREPKQMLPLAGTEPLLRQAVRRLDGLVATDHVLVVTGASLAARTAELLPEDWAGLRAGGLFFSGDGGETWEPRSRGVTVAHVLSLGHPPRGDGRGDRLDGLLQSSAAAFDVGLPQPHAV